MQIVRQVRSAEGSAELWNGKERKTRNSMATYRIVKDGITPGCPIYRVDKKHFLYWSIGAEDFMPNYNFYSVEDAIKAIREKNKKAKIYIQVPIE